MACTSSSSGVDRTGSGICDLFVASSDGAKASVGFGADLQSNGCLMTQTGDGNRVVVEVLTQL